MPHKKSYFLKFFSVNPLEIIWIFFVGVVGDHEGNGAVQGHRAVQLVLEHVQVVEAVGVGIRGRWRRGRWTRARAAWCTLCVLNFSSHMSGSVSARELFQCGSSLFVFFVVARRMFLFSTCIVFFSTYVDVYLRLIF